MQPSRQSLIKTQFKRLTVLKGSPVEQEAIQAWIETLLPVVDHVGEPRFLSGVARCLRELQFFPTPATLREMIPNVSESERHFRGCPRCEFSSGYVIKTRPHPWAERAGQLETYAAKCDHGEARQ